MHFDEKSICPIRVPSNILRESFTYLNSVQKSKWMQHKINSFLKQVAEFYGIIDVDNFGDTYYYFGHTKTQFIEKYQRIKFYLLMTI